MAQERRQAARPRPRRDLAHAQILGQQQLRDRVDHVLPGLGEVLAEHAALPLHQLGAREVAQPQIVPRVAAGVAAGARFHRSAQPTAYRLIRESLLQLCRARLPGPTAAT